MKNFKLRLLRSLVFRGEALVSAAPEAFAKAAALVLLDLAQAFDVGLRAEENERDDLWALQQRVTKLEKGKAP